MTVLRPSAGNSARNRNFPSRQLAGLAIDLGHARTRAWAPGRGLVLDTRTVTFPGPGSPGGPSVSYPLQRGSFVDPDGAARMLDRLLGRRVPRLSGLVIALTTPVLGGIAYREAARTALRVLRPRTILTIPTAKAIALGVDAEPSRPLLIVDVGARLTEVFLLADGAVADAHRTPLGTDDLGHVPHRELTGFVVNVVGDMLRRDSSSQTLDALHDGVLVAGGGALRPEIVRDLCRQLRVSVRPAPAPHTAAVRGAAKYLQTVRALPPEAEAPPG